MGFAPFLPSLGLVGGRGVAAAPPPLTAVAVPFTAAPLALGVSAAAVLSWMLSGGSGSPSASKLSTS